MKFFLNFSVLFVSLLSCSNNQQPNDPIPAHETFTIDSKYVNEKRVITVWFPDEYKNSTDSLPVLYMPDGGIKEDFPHIANTLSELIKAKKIKPFILVGIENTQRRRDLTPPTSVAKDKEIAPVVGGSAAFRQFIQAELIPEIQKKYRTTAKKGVIGESLAGLFVTETFLIAPDMFDFYIAFDPSLWWNNKQLLKDAPHHLKSFPGTAKTFWFAGSSAKDIFENTTTLSKVLTSRTLPNLKWNYSPEKKEEHHTIFRATKEKALIWSLN